MSDADALVRLSPERDDPETLARAADVLRDGGLLVFPTETFYGLGCDPRNEEAVARLAAAKGRPPDRPLPLVIGCLSQLPGVATGLEPPFAELADRFWPGPLSLVLPAANGLAGPVTAGTGTVAVRWTSSAPAQRLALAFGGGLVATSANRSGEPPSCTAAEAARALSGRVDLVLDAGRTPGGLPSTLVDLTRRPPVTLREGAVPLDQLEALLGTR